MKNSVPIEPGAIQHFWGSSTDFSSFYERRERRSNWLLSLCCRLFICSTCIPTFHAHFRQHCRCNGAFFRAQLEIASPGNGDRKKGNHHRLLFFLVSFLSEFSLAFNDECHWIGVDETIYQTFLKWKRLKPQISINTARFFMRFSCSARLSISNFGVVFLIKIYHRNI